MPHPPVTPAKTASGLSGVAGGALLPVVARSPFAFAASAASAGGSVPSSSSLSSPSPPLMGRTAPPPSETSSVASGSAASTPGLSGLHHPSAASSSLALHLGSSPVAARLEALLSEEDALAEAEAAQAEAEAGGSSNGGGMSGSFVLPPAASASSAGAQPSSSGGGLALVRSSSSSSHSLLGLPPSMSSSLSSSSTSSSALVSGAPPPSHSSASGALFKRHAHPPVPLLSAQVLPANQYVQLRSGSILSRGMILKADQFPQENLREGLDMHILGAPNFQQVRPCAIYSTGQPSVSGIRTVLNLLRLKQSPRRRVQWINLREEPVVYLNNRPFVLRELEQPFHNLTDFSSIARERLEGIESRLKNDILLEGESQYGNVLVHDEEELGEIRACWNSVWESNVKTSQEVYAQLRAEKYEVHYLRVPVTAESLVGTSQLDAIVKCFIEAAALYTSSAAEPAGPIETYFVLNDQMGRGRSTIGMIAIYLLIKQHERNQQQALVNSGKLGATTMLAHSSSSGHPPLHHAAAHESSGFGAHHEHDGLSAYRRGEYDVMLRLMRVLRAGRAAKRRVDDAIDRCGRVHHLREQILESFVASEHARASDAAQAFSSTTAGYMKRYFLLVCFQAYLDDVTEHFVRATGVTGGVGATGTGAGVGATAAGSGVAQPSVSAVPTRELDSSATFTSWWSSHPELEKLMTTLEQDESMMQVVPSGLEAVTATITGGGTPMMTTTPPAGGERISSDEGGKLVLSPNTDGTPLSALTDVCSVLDLAVFRRSGQVLSKRSILMSEFHLFSTRQQRFLFEHGLPNFRYYESMPLAATAQPNVRGIRNILHLLADTSRRRDRRIQAEAAAAMGEDVEDEDGSTGKSPAERLSEASHHLSNAEFDERLRELVHKHANVERRGALPPGTGSSGVSGVLGHHSASALNLTRGVSDGSAGSVGGGAGGIAATEEESMRYRAGTGPQTSAAALAHAHAHHAQLLHDAGLGRPALSHTASLPQSFSSDFCPVLWINLREEPVLFVNEEPYLVRDYVHPFRVLTEFQAGMTRTRTEQIEERLKGDVVAELADSIVPRPEPPAEEASTPAAQAAAALHAQHQQVHPGRPKIVVHEETASGHIRPRFEVVSQPLVQHVQTTAEVYASLRAAGYPITYARVPLHVDESPSLRSFDLLFELLNAHQIVEEKISVVFNCQKGGRRSTMGMVVCVLMLMHQRSVHYSLRRDEGEGDGSGETAGFDAGEDGSGVVGVAGGSTGTKRKHRRRALSAEEKLQALHLSLARHRDDGTTLESLNDADQDDANVHGHTVSISAHAVVNTRPKRANHAKENNHNNLGVPSSAAPSVSPPSGSVGGAEEAIPADAQVPTIPTPAPSLKKSPSTVSIHISDVDRRSTRARYGRGEFKGILGLIRILKQGARAKEEVDVAIDAVGGIVNIRDSIAEAKTRADAQRVPQQEGGGTSGDGRPKRRGGLLSKALKYLESYAYLICFNAYLRERRDAEEEEEARQQEQEAAGDMDSARRVQFAPPSAVPGAEEQTRAASPSADAVRSRADSGAAAAPGEFPSFSRWIHSRPELRKQLDYIHHEAEDALKINLVALSAVQQGGAAGAEAFAITAAGVAGGDAAALYASRAGNVLLPGSILKKDWFRGASNPNMAQFITGAINFRPIERFPVAGTGIPTVQGIRGVLHYYMTGVAPCGGIMAPVRASTLLWFNLREEPLLYINETPFVLRDSDEPYINVEHTGINTRRLEAMERQLRRDLLVEGERNMQQLMIMEQQQQQQLQLQPDSPMPDSPSPTASGSVGVGGGMMSSSPPLPSTSPPTDASAPPVTQQLQQISSDRRVLLHDEDDNGNLIAVWHNDINAISVQTPQMQFLRCFEEAVASSAAADFSHQEAEDNKVIQAQQQQLQQEHVHIGSGVMLAPVSSSSSLTSSSSSSSSSFLARYFRTPITDEQAPGPATLDDLVRALETARDAPSPVLVFNCQMGRGRTTTGLIIGCLWCIFRGKVVDFNAWLEGTSAPSTVIRKPAPVSPITAKMQAAMAAQAAENAPPALTLPAAAGSDGASASPAAAAGGGSTPTVTTSTSSSYLAPSSIAGEDAAAETKREAEFANGLRHGWYKVIQSLVRVINDGPYIKKLVDRVIDQSVDVAQS